MPDARIVISRPLPGDPVARLRAAGFEDVWVNPDDVLLPRAKLLEVNVPAGPVLPFDQLTTDPNLLARQMIVDFEQPGAGTMKIPGSPFKLSETPAEFALPAPLLGQHNAEVYSKLLGISQEELKKWEEEEIV